MISISWVVKRSDSFKPPVCVFRKEGKIYLCYLGLRGQVIGMTLLLQEPPAAGCPRAIWIQTKSVMHCEMGGKHVATDSNPRTYVEMLGVMVCLWNSSAEEMGLSKSPGLINQTAYPIQWEPDYWKTVSQKHKGRCHLRNDSHGCSMPSTCSHVNEHPHAHMHLRACTHMHRQSSREIAPLLWNVSVV